MARNVKKSSKRQMTPEMSRARRRFLTMLKNSFDERSYCFGEYEIAADCLMCDDMEACRKETQELSRN